MLLQVEPGQNRKKRSNLIANMSTGQQIIFELMADLPLDPLKARKALWKRLFRASKGLRRRARAARARPSSGAR